MEKIKYTFQKEERLCNKKLFDELFTSGETFLVYPLKVLYTDAAFDDKFPVKTAFAVGKKGFKKAVSRNLIKRRMREAYRLNKHLLYSGLKEQKLAVVFVYVGKKTESFQLIQRSMIKSLKTIISKSPQITPETERIRRDTKNPEV